MRWVVALLTAAVLGAGCSKQTNTTVAVDGDTYVPPAWHFDPVDHRQANVTYTGVWGNSDGAVFVVGWYGTIITNMITPQNPDGRWWTMSTPTMEHLTAITGVENGTLFGLPAAEGEMIAVGWNGTVLHYHPNPDRDPVTKPGTWTQLTGFVPLLKEDPFCPDYDGDGIGDDGDGDGWWGNDICTGGARTNCDDNCRTSANGTQRPLVDIDMNTCLTIPPDGASPDMTRIQRDLDNDGLGQVCDDDEGAPAPPPEYTPTLFGVWAQDNGAALQIAAVGEGGALLTFNGQSASSTGAGPLQAIDSPRAWTAQTQLPFRFRNDCPPATPAGQDCMNGRLPPSCPAQCSAARSTCMCTVAMGQCCDPGAPTGVGCGDGSCGVAANACNTATGFCSALCPGCFRRLNQTLRSIAGSNNALVAVGARGTILLNDTMNLDGVWSAPFCSPKPKPLDESPLLVDVHGSAGQFTIVGAAGAVFTYDRTACGITSLLGSPPGFLSGVYSRAANVSYIVGDRGLLLDANAGAMPPVDAFGTDFDENFQDVWVTQNPNNALNQDMLWMVGATGQIILGQFF